jgi:hypothetical protein
MTQQLFEDMIGSPPPSTVDVEAIIATQRRQRRWRTAAAGGAVAAAIVGLLVGFGAIAADNTSTAPPVPGAPPSSGPAPGREDTATTEHRLTEALRQAVRREAPAAELSELEGGDPGDPFTVVHRECGSANPPRSMPVAYFADAGVRVGKHAGILTVELGYDVKGLYCGLGFARMEPKWAESVGPRGQAVFTSREPDSVRIRILVVRPDGSYVAILHAPRWPTLTSASLSLTVDQVRKIALDPALEL